jgi:hypothetical protein
MSRTTATIIDEVIVPIGKRIDKSRFLEER